MQQASYDWTAVALSAKVTPICRWLQTVVRHHFPWKRCEVVYQGVNPKRFRPQTQVQPTFTIQKPAVAILQNHSVFPKVQGLLDFRTVIERLPWVHFYIAEGEAWAQRFLPAVKEHYVGISNVHFLRGITSPEAVSQMITACDCYVLASGLASRVGGVPEIIEDGLTGWSIDNSNPIDWVNKIESLVNDVKLCKRMGRQGREWVAEKFGWPTITPQVERLIIQEATQKR
jgi:hypothetical protein